MCVPKSEWKQERQRTYDLSCICYCNFCFCVCVFFLLLWREVEEAYQKFEESEEHIKVLQIDLSDAVIYLQLDNDCAALIKRNP